MPSLSRRLARTAFAGMLAWGGLLFVRLGTEAGVAEQAAHLVLLAPLALVPLFLDASVPAGFGPAPRALVAASWLVLPGALGAAAAFVLPAGPAAGALAGLWVVPTVAVAVWAVRTGADRWRASGLDAAEAALVLGWAVLPSAAVWLAVARSGLATGYGETVDVLTATHLHYAGSLTLVWAGLLGRTLGPAFSPLYRALAAGLVGGFWAAAAGIALGGAPVGGAFIETVGVVVLGVSAVGVGVLGVVQAGRLDDRTAGLMVAASGGALALATGLALWFHLGWRLGGDGPDVAQMTAQHGWLNAFGFGLWGALGWRRVRPRPRG